jgi:hypothetical protein
LTDSYSILAVTAEGENAFLIQVFEAIRRQSEGPRIHK